MRTAALRARTLQSGALGAPLAVLIVGACVIWCWNLVAWILRFIESVLWPQSAPWMSDPQPSRRFSWLGSLLCCRSDSAMMDPSSNTPSRRNRPIPMTAGSPAHWDPIDPAHGNSTLVLLSKDNPKHASELAQVQQNWFRTCGVGSIVTVHRVQNLTLWRAYEAKKIELQKSCALAQSDVVVYHGTRGNAPELIHASDVGFNPQRGSGGFGYTWFAEQAGYSTRSFAHAVLSARIPFHSPSLHPKQTSNQPYWQVLQAQILITATAQSSGQVTQNGRAPRVRDEAGVHIVPESAMCLPTHLLTYQSQ